MSGFLGVNIMCPSRMKGLLFECAVFMSNSMQRSNTKHISSSSHQKGTRSCNEIADTLLTWQ